MRLVPRHILCMIERTGLLRSYGLTTDASSPIIASLNDISGIPDHCNAYASRHLKPPCSLTVCIGVIESLISDLQTEDPEKSAARGLPPVSAVY